MADASLFKRSPDQLASDTSRGAARGELALALRQAGKTFAAVGLELGCSRARAQQIVARAAGAHWSAHLPGRVRTFLHHAGLAARCPSSLARSPSCHVT